MIKIATVISHKHMEDSVMNLSAIVASLTIAMVIGTGPLQAESGSTTLSKANVEQIVREYILQHPDVLMESVRAYQDRERAAAQQRSTTAIAANSRQLFDDAASPVAGNAGADVTIVEFFDYNCHYCRRVSPVLTQLLQDHKNVRLIFKELPILGPGSHMASRAALAAQKQGAYLAFHRELMSLSKPVTADDIDKAATKLGLDADRLKADMSSAEVQASLAANRQLAEAIAVQSTPSLVVGNELVSGALDASGFEELISRSVAPRK
jgi:protein-disulfide isomerase